MESPEAHPCSGDWSPRISFSYGFATKQRISSPAKYSPIHDSDFEFSSFIGADLTPKWCMLSADELFSNGKLRLVEGSSEFGMTDSEWREEEGTSVCRDNVGEIRRSVMESIDTFERDLPTIRVRKAEEEVVVNASTSTRSDGSNQADALRSLTNRGDLLSAFRKQEKERSPASREDVNSAQMRETCENAGECKLPTSRKDVVHVQECKKGGKSASPTKREEVVYVQKLEMGAKASKIRLPTSREDLIPASKPENGSKASKLRSPTSREELLLACGRSDDKATMAVSLGKARELTNRECLKSPCMIAVRCEETRTPVRWRGEALSFKKNEDDEHASQLKRFSRHPRSASMTMGGFSELANRTCVSLDNSRCPSPSRSFSLPATSPTSPTASRSFSIFPASSSSSSSGYRSRIKDFFQLKKQAAKEAEPSPPSCTRLLLSPSSFLPFFRRRGASTNAADVSTPTGSQREHEQPFASKQASKEQKIIATSCQGQVSSLHKELDNASVKPAHIAITSPEQSAFRNLSSSDACREDALKPSVVGKSAHNAIAKPATIGSRHRIRHSYSLPHEKLVLGKDGQIVLGIDEALWNEANINIKSNIVLTESHAKQSNQRSNMVNSRGNLVRHHSKGLERPIPYTSSVRVTPVLNVPSCITPSLRKAKPSSSKHKSFSFSRIFPRGKAPAGSPNIAPTCEGM